MLLHDVANVDEHHLQIGWYLPLSPVQPTQICLPKLHVMTLTVNNMDTSVCIWSAVRVHKFEQSCFHQLCVFMLIMLCVWLRLREMQLISGHNIACYQYVYAVYTHRLHTCTCTREVVHMQPAVHVQFTLHSHTVVTNLKPWQSLWLCEGNVLYPINPVQYIQCCS